MKNFLLSVTVYQCIILTAQAQSICFSGPTTHFITGSGAGIYGAVADDFNNDSLIDLVTTNSTNNTISIMLGDGNGGFGPATHYAAGSTSSGMSEGDFNNDGELDVVVTNQASNDISVLLGNGDGTFNASINTSIVSGSPHVVICHDFDNDTIVDIAVGCSGGALIILKGDGTGNFSVLNTYSTVAWMGSISLADFDNDGILDIALPGGFGYSIIFYPGQGGGNFAAPVTVPCSERPFYLTAADLNNDTLPDIIAANTQDTSVTIFFSAGNFSLAPPVNYDNTSIYAGPDFVALADFNNDTLDDILISYFYSGSVSILPGLGNGNFSGVQHFNASSGTALAVVTDLNQDNKPDIIHPDDGFPAFSVLLNCTPSGLPAIPTQNHEVKIYPSIVSDFFNIEITGINLSSLHSEISIYEPTGKMVLQYPDAMLLQAQSDTYSIRLNCPSLPAGNYYIKIVTASIKEKERRYVLNGKIVII